MKPVPNQFPTSSRNRQGTTSSRFPTPYRGEPVELVGCESENLPPSQFPRELVRQDIRITMKPNKETFRAWLTKQRHSESPTGDIARDIFGDPRAGADHGTHPTAFLHALKPVKFAHYCIFRALTNARIGGTGQKGQTHYWRHFIPGFVGLRWISVTEYAEGIIRFRNDLMPDPPQYVWPAALPYSHPNAGQFELTCLPDEIPDLADDLVRWASDLPTEITHPLFRDGGPCGIGYQWTARAKAAQDKRSAEGDALLLARRARRARQLTASNSSDGGTP